MFAILDLLFIIIRACCKNVIYIKFIITTVRGSLFALMFTAIFTKLWIITGYSN